VTIKHRKSLQRVKKAIEAFPHREEFDGLRTAVQSALDEQDKKLADTDQKALKN
jgi:hypothetical protein